MKKPAIILLIAVLLFLAGLSGYLFLQYRASLKQIKHLREDPQQATIDTNKKILAKVARLAVLPTGEEPTVATVSDPEKLKTQSFFAKAEKDDKVLIYTNAKKAYLYSVKLDKILEIAPVNIGDASSTPDPAATPKR